MVKSKVQTVLPLALIMAGLLRGGEMTDLNSVEALEKKCAEAKTGAARVEAQVHLPAPCGDTTGILSDITDTWAFARHWLFRLSDFCVLVLPKRSDRDKIIEALIPGQPCRIAGKVRKFVWRDIAAGGKLQPRFAVEIQDFSPRAQPPSAVAEAQYAEISPEDIMRQPREMGNRGVACDFAYEELAAVSREESDAIGLEAGAWAWLKHSTNNGAPRLLVHRQTQADVAQIKASSRGQRLAVKGHLCTLAIGGKPVLVLVADAVSVAGAPNKSDIQAKTLPSFATAEYPYYPKLLAVLKDTIHGKTHRDKRYTILIPYRGHEPAPAEALQSLPALRGLPCWRLRLADDDDLGSIIVLAPDREGKIGHTLANAEPGDTLILRCRIAALNDTNYIEVAAVELPPLLPP